MTGGNGKNPGKQPTPEQLERAQLENRALLLTDRIEALVATCATLERQVVENLAAFGFQVEESNRLEQHLRDLVAAVAEHVRRGEYSSAVPGHLKPYLEKAQAELERRNTKRIEALARIKALHAGEVKP